MENFHEEDFLQTSNLLELVNLLNRSKISDKQKKFYFETYFEKVARSKKIPREGHFELTPLCNLDCKMCYVHIKNDNEHHIKLLPVAEWENLIYSAHLRGMTSATLTGGECLTYPGFDNIYLYLQSLGVRVNVITNGLLLDSTRIDFFEAHKPNQLRITLYGGSDDAYEKVTGFRVFERVYHNLCKLKETNLPVVITLTPSEFMRDDIDQLVTCAQKLGFIYKVNSRLVTPRNNTKRYCKDLDLDGYVNIYKRIKQLKGINSNNPFQPFDEPIENSSHELINGLSCGGGRSTFAISWNGKMSPCVNLYDSHVDVLKLGFDEAWKQINKIAQSYIRPIECDTCKYKSKCLTCVAMHNKAERFGHCDKSICDRMRRLIEEGLITI